MHTILPPSRLLFAAAMIALGITGLVNGDFALVWQAIPLQHLPGRTAIAYACAIIELATGIGLLLPGTVRPASRVLFPYMVLWLVLLEIPVVVHAPGDVGSWGSIGEIGTMVAGVWCVYARYGGNLDAGNSRFPAGANGIRAARWLLVATLAMLGAEIIVDALAAGNGVMQPWLQALPSPAAWAILTGIGSIATCLALLFGVWPRLAATLEAAMIALVGLAYWAPDLYTGRTATTAFIITILDAAGVWLVAATYRDVGWFAVGHPVWKAGAHDPVRMPPPTRGAAIG